MAGSDLGSIRAKLILDIKDFNKKFDEAEKKAQSSAKGISSKLNNMGDSLIKSSKKVSLAVSAPMTGLIVSGAKMAMSTEKSFNTVRGITKLAGSEWDSYVKDMRKGANTIGKTYDEYAQATYQAISAGVKHTDTVKFLDKANKLAVVGQTDLTKATDLLTTVQNAYGLSAEDTTRISDVLIRTQDKGKTTVDELASAMGKVIPTAKANGVEIEQLGAAYAIMTSEGIATAEATTYMNSMFNELGKGGTKVSEVLKEVSGKSFPDLMKEGKSVGDVLQILKDYADENNMAFTDLFGSAEAGKAALALLGDGADKFNGQLENMANASGETANQFDTVHGKAMSFDEAMAQLKNSLVDIVKSLQPVLEKITELAKKFAEWTQHMMETNPHFADLVAYSMLFLAVLGPLMGIVGNVIKLFGTFGKAISKVSKAFKWVTKGGLKPFVQALKGKLVGNLLGAKYYIGLFKDALVKMGSFIVKTAVPALWNLAKGFLVAIGPVGWVILAIMAIVAVFVILWNKCDWFREFWINLWEKLKDACSKAIDWIKTQFDRFTTFISELPDKISKFIDDTVQWFSTLPERIWEWLVDTCTRISEWVMQLVEQGLEAGSQFIDSVITWFCQLPGKIWEWLMSTTTQTGIWVDQMIDKAIEVGSQFLGQLIAWFILLPVRIGEWLWNALVATGEWAIEMWNKAYEAGSNFLDKLIEWFCQLPGKVWEWLVNAWDKTSEWASNMWDKATETGSNFLNRIGEWFSQLGGKIWNWLVDAYNRTVQWAQQMWNKAREAGQQFVDRCIQFIQQLPGKVWQWLSQVIQKAIQWAKDFARKGKEGAENMGKNVVNGIKSLPDKVANIGKDIVHGLWNGISGAGGWLFNKVSTFASGVLSSMKGALGIHSPSRKMRDEVGKWITRGVGVGIMDEYGALQKQLERMSYNIVSTLQIEQSDLMATNNGILDVDNQRLLPNATTNTNQVVNHTTKIDLHIGQFINSRKDSIEDLMQRMYDYDRDKKFAKGEVVL